MLPGLPDRRLTEIEDLRASRRRLVIAAGEDRRRIERELHEGVQQQLVALAVKIQLGAQADEVAHEVARAIEELRRLAERIHPPLLESGGLARALRSAAASAEGTIEIAADFSCPPELVATVHACCVEALERGMPIALRTEDGTLVFEIAEGADQPETVQRIRDRVEAMGGRLIERPPSE